MTTAELIGIIIGLVTIVGAIIGVWSNTRSEIAILKTENSHFKDEHKNLSERVNKLEDDLYKKMDKILEKLNKIEISIAGNK